MAEKIAGIELSLVMFQSINYRTLLFATIITGVLAIITYFGAFAYTEGETGIFIDVLRVLFNILTFPLLNLLVSLKFVSGLSLAITLVVNSLIYGLLLERLQWLQANRHKWMPR